MFNVVEHKFATVEHKFSGAEYKFNDVEHKIIIGIRIPLSGVAKWRHKTKKQLNQEEKTSFSFELFAFLLPLRAKVP